jgi:hypothetical protein
MQYTLLDVDHLEIAKGMLLKAIRMRAERGDHDAAKDIAKALENVGPLMAACNWTALLHRSFELINQAKGGMR